jgi:hypothetical protein
MKRKTLFTVICAFVFLFLLTTFAIRSTEAVERGSTTAPTPNTTRPWYEEVIPGKDRRAAYRNFITDRQHVIYNLLSVVKEKKNERLQNMNGSLVYYAVCMLGDLRAEEAVQELLAGVDIRFVPVGAVTIAPTDPEVVQALAKIGKPASVKALTYIAKDNSPERANMYVRVIALVEGVELGKVMVSQAAEKEKDPQYKERLKKAIELFKDADKVVQ